MNGIFGSDEFAPPDRYRGPVQRDAVTSKGHFDADALHPNGVRRVGQQADGGRVAVEWFRREGVNDTKRKGHAPAYFSAPRRHA